MTARSQLRKRRLVERSEARRRAARVVVPPHAHLVVCGGGASGLTAAIAASRQGLNVVVLEAQEQLGAKILATGNGRCNLANRDLSAHHYHAPAFAAKVMGEHPLQAILDFFEELGLAVVAEEDRFYPQSRQAQSLRNLLLVELERLGVVLAPLRKVVAVSPGAAPPAAHLATSWHVRYRDASHPPRTGTAELPALHTITAQTVLVATGGGAFDVLSELSLAQTPTRPGLCGLLCNDSPLFGLSGRKAEASLALLRQGKVLAEGRGEVLFRARGLSGPVVFDLSRLARPGDELLLNLTPMMSPQEITRHLERWIAREGKLTSHALDGLLDPTIGRLLVALAKEGWPLPADSVLESLAALAQRIPFVVSGYDTTNAQLTLGGLALNRVDPTTMALSQDAQGRTLPRGLFASGEVLDVDGPCGGYNLAFAWLSGLKAGHSAAELVRQAQSGGRS